MNKLYTLKFAAMFLVTNSVVHGMVYNISQTKTALTKKQRFYIVSSTDINPQKEREAYYKQLCPEITYGHNNRTTQIIQFFAINTGKNSIMAQEDKMAYYKQFISKTE